MHPMILEDLAKIHQQELLKEADSWRVASLVIGNKPDKIDLALRIMIDVAQRKLNFHLLQELKLKHFERLSPRSQ